MTRPKLVHLGEILEHEFIEPFDLSSHLIAKNIGVKPVRINEIVRARPGITAKKALRLS
jgi:addiction module HigA family antidote